MFEKGLEELINSSSELAAKTAEALTDLTRVVEALANEVMKLKEDVKHLIDNCK